MNVKLCASLKLIKNQLAIIQDDLFDISDVRHEMSQRFLCNHRRTVWVDEQTR